MNGILYYPSRSCDVHMGGMDFQCHECHETRNHKIAGRSISLPVAEGSRSCEDCHSAQPHKPVQKGKGGRKLLLPHLNRHTEHLHCQTCHSPVYAKCRPTKTWWDWSKAGDKKRKPEKDEYGMDDYFWKKGEFEWKESVKPTYLWYNGKVKRYGVGDPISWIRPATSISQPWATKATPSFSAAGSRNCPWARRPKPAKPNDADLSQASRGGRAARPAPRGPRPMMGLDLRFDSVDGVDEVDGVDFRRPSFRPMNAAERQRHMAWGFNPRLFLV